jgi:Flp pilus assembly protein TadG
MTKRGVQQAVAVVRLGSLRSARRCSPGGFSAWKDRQPAQAAVEFALVLLPMLLLLGGGIDLARIFYYDVVISSAANEGVRAAAAGAPDSDSTATVNGQTVTVLSVKTIAQNSAPAGVICDTCVTVDPAPAQRRDGTSPVWTTVTAQYTFTPVTPLILAIWQAARGGSNPPIKRMASQRMRANCALADGTPCS